MEEELAYQYKLRKGFKLREGAYPRDRDIRHHMSPLESLQLDVLLHLSLLGLLPIPMEITQHFVVHMVKLNQHLMLRTTPLLAYQCNNNSSPTTHLVYHLNMVLLR